MMSSCGQIRSDRDKLIRKAVNSHTQCQGAHVRQTDGLKANRLSSFVGDTCLKCLHGCV